MPYPFLAFGFGAPWLLAGLALAAIPIILHLLYKRRYREVEWAAMKFLLEASRKNSRRIRLEQLLLLAVRVLILVLVVGALAEPYVESFGESNQAAAPTQRIIVLDASFSMGTQVGENTRFDRARRIAERIVQEARPGDGLHLARIANSEPRIIVRQPAYQREPILQEIDRLALTQESGDLQATLERLLEMLGGESKFHHSEIYFLSDFQRPTWLPNAPESLQSSLANLAERAKLVMIDVGEGFRSNVAATTLSADEQLIPVGTPTTLRATAKNFGATKTGPLNAELYADGRLIDTRAVELPPAGESTLTFERTFTTAGEHRLELRLPSDALDIDNHRWLSVSIRDEVHVLLVDGQRSGRAQENATYYLQTALAPQTKRQSWEGFMRPRAISEGELLGADLSLYDCVFLCNVARFIPREAELLRRYLESGGGVVFCLGDQVAADNYNLVLGADGADILPAKLGDRVGSAKEPSESSLFRFDTADLTHPIVSAYEGNIGTGLESTMTFEYVKLAVPEQSKSRVALRFDRGDPAIVETNVGRGRSVLIATSVDNRWGPWPLQRSFPPIVHELVRFAISGQASDRQRLVGEPITESFAIRPSGSAIVLKRPDNRSVTLPISENSDQAGVTYTQTDHSGIYELTVGSPVNRFELFAVNVDTKESDLTPVSESELNSGTLNGVEYVYRTEWQGFEDGAARARSEYAGLSRWLLLAALCLVFVEQVMAWRFFYGFVLLYALVSAGFVWPTFRWHPAAGIILLLAFGGLFALLMWWRNRRDVLQLRSHKWARN